MKVALELLTSRLNMRAKINSYFVWEHEWSKVLVFAENDVYLGKYEIEGIEHNVLTLDQWFEKEKIKV